MDIPIDVLEKLRCDQCHEYLSCGPIYLRHDEETVCGRCSTLDEPATRNKQYEAVAQLLKFPCKYQEEGCDVKLEFSNDGQPHETACNYRSFVCPILESGACEWIGKRSSLLEHCRLEHSERVLENPCSLTHDLSQPNQKTFLLVAFQLLFLLHTKVCTATRKIYHSIRYLGNTRMASNFEYTLDIKRQKCNLLKTGHVAPEGCRSIQEDTSIATDINSLLAILEGFEGTTFNIDLKKVAEDVVIADEPVIEPEDSESKNMALVASVQCAKGCGVNVTKFVYRDEKGWRCERCSPTRVPCCLKSKGCLYTDIFWKCLKHHSYFCEYSTFCYICRRNMAPSCNTLVEHYSMDHNEVMYSSGSEWRTIIDNTVRWSVIMGDAGVALFCYWQTSWLTSSKPKLQLFVPIVSEQLEQYSCTVQLTDPRTKRAIHREMELSYNNCYDWETVLKKTDLPFDCKEFDIIVEINKKAK